MPRRLLLPLAIALLAALGLASCSHDAPSQGKPLPDAKLVDLGTQKAAAWPDNGKPTVVNFWASWCTPCRKEMPAFDEVAAKVDGEVNIIGVTDDDDLDAAKAAAKKAGVHYPLLVDQDQTLITDLALSGLPGTVFVDADGKVVGKHLGALTEAELTKQIEDRYGITT
ncbi:MAG: TlpA disulfide reductase family protein [Acidimicrobiales bacterium]